MLHSIRLPSQSMVERFGTSPSNSAARIARLECTCRAMRAQGLADHWAYDLALHRNLLTVLAVGARGARCHRYPVDLP
jgi:hypothetical protein